MFKYKIDVMKALKEKGYTATLCRKKKLLPESTMQRFRHGEPVGMEAINTVCLILECQPSDIFEIIPTKEELKKIQ